MGVIIFLCFETAFAERASIVIDTDSGAVLYAKNARLRSYPASLTKLMTVYLLLETVESTPMTLDEQLHVSVSAAEQPPVKLGLRRGWTITVQEVLQALIVRSANDAAVVAAERLAGSETAFANIMTAKARTLGMSDTILRNASGLQDFRQITTARDMAILARALQLNFSGYYHLFSSRTLRYRGKTFRTRNNFNTIYKGAQGLKTGFTCNAGYNLLVSVERDGRRVIGVILGAPNARRRNARMAKLLDDAFIRKHLKEKHLTIDSLLDAPDQGAGVGLNRHALADTCIVKAPADGYNRVSGWTLVVGVRKDRQQALALASAAVRQNPKTLKRGRAMSIAFLRGVLLYRAWVTGLKKEDALVACKNMRKSEKYCIVMKPKNARIYLAKSRIALERAQASEIGNPAGVK